MLFSRDNGSFPQKLLLQRPGISQLERGYRKIFPHDEIFADVAPFLATNREVFTRFCLRDEMFADVAHFS